MIGKRAEQLLSRGIDGELSAGERAELDRLLASDPELRKLEAEWSSYAEMLRAQPAPAAPPPDAAWADVRRAIRLDAAAKQRDESAVFGWRLAWAGVMIGLILLGFSAILLRQALTGRGAEPRAAAEKDVEVEFVETDLPGASPMVYEDAETGWTVIWVAGLENGKENAKGS
jgi:anti-sigma factor RsiW